MTFIIPNQQTKKIRQINSGELSGELFVTKNIDLTKEGHIKLSHPSVAIMTTDDDADFNQADAMNRSANEMFLTSKYVMSGNIGLETITKRSTDTNAPQPGVEEDIIYFNGVEVVTSGTSIFYRSATTTWTSVAISGMSLSYPSCLDVLDKFNSILIGNANKVFKVNTSWVLDPNPLVLPADYNVTSICSNNDTVYIATRHIANGEAKLFIWDGTSSAHNGSYGVGTHEISSVKKYKSSCALITSKGQLLQFNGGGFTELANLPVYYTNRDWMDALNDHNSISNRGMVVDIDKIYLRLDSTSASSINGYNSYFIGGLWCYDPNNGLYCINTPSYSRVKINTIATTDVNTTTDVITISSGVPVTGTPVMFIEGSSTPIGGLITKTIYYVIYLSGTTFKLASTLTNALAGTAIDLTSTGNSFQQMFFFLMNDYGFSYCNNRGSIGLLTNTIGTLGAKNDRLVYSSRLSAKQAISTVKVCLNVNTPLVPNRGYFITPKLNSSNLEDIYNTVSLKYKPLKVDDSIIIKYKNVDKLNVPFGSLDNGQGKIGTWTDTNTFTTTLDMTNAVIGDEIEIVAGVGSGCLFHIESLSNNAGTWTINLTESFIFAVANDVMYFYVDNWSILDTITSTNQNGQEFKNIPLDKASKFVQLKVELRGIDVDIEELQITNDKLTKAR